MTTEPGTLDTRLSELADELARRAPRGAGDVPAELAGLLPCEPAIGEVAIACWVSNDGGEAFELVSLETGSVVEDQVALREAFTLVAMAETLEELADPETLDALLDAVEAWRARHVPDHGLDAALEQAMEAVRDVRAARVGGAGDGAARMASPLLLDLLGSRLRQLETRWGRLEQAAEAWSDERMEAAGRHEAAGAADAANSERSDVTALWEALSLARRGPLSRSAGAAVHEGREAGLALFAAVAAASAEAG